MRFIQGLVLCLAVVLTGCASGVKHKDMQASIPAIKADSGRIFFYRSSSMFGAAIQPNILLDGKVVGESQPGGFFFVDSSVGNHEVSTSTEVEKKVTFTLAKGEVKYVKTSVSFGALVGRIIPELVNAAEGEKELADLSFTGTLSAAK